MPALFCGRSGNHLAILASFTKTSVPALFMRQIGQPRGGAPYNPPPPPAAADGRQAAPTASSEVGSALLRSAQQIPDQCTVMGIFFATISFGAFIVTSNTPS